MERWPFAEPPNFEAFTTRQLFDQRLPILRVYHDVEDGAWQFHGPEDWEPGDIVVICLEHAFTYDPSVGAVADLPRGWGAQRSSPTEPWVRFQVPPDEE